MPTFSLKTNTLQLIKNGRKVLKENDASKLFDLLLLAITTTADAHAALTTLTSRIKTAENALQAGAQHTPNTLLPKTPLTTLPRSYAAAAAAATTADTPAPKSVSIKTLREITVASGNETQAQKQRNGYTLLADINKSIQGEKTVAVRQLSSGDVALAFETPAEKA